MADTPDVEPDGNQLRVRVTRLRDGETYIPTGDMVAYLRAMATDAPNWAGVDDDAPTTVHDLVAETLGMCALGIARHADRLDCLVMMMLSRPPDFVVDDSQRGSWRRLLDNYAAFAAALVLGDLGLAVVSVIAQEMWSELFTYVVLVASLAANVLSIFALRRSSQESKRVTAEYERVTKIIEVDQDGPPPDFT